MLLICGDVVRDRIECVEFFDGKYFVNDKPAEVCNKKLSQFEQCHEMILFSGIFFANGHMIHKYFHSKISIEIKV